MKRRFFVLLLVMLLSITSIACADSYILHKPDKNQLQENEALEIAREFLLDLTGVEITGVFKVVNGMKVKGKAEAFFGPGYQWGADTNDDCWVLVIQNDSTIVRPWVVIHGTTGEVLYWQYTDQTTGCAYLNALPTEGQLSYEDAVALAKNRFLQAMNEPSSIEDSAIYINPSFGNTNHWNTSAVNMGTVLAWNINLSYADSTEQYGYFVYINAENEEILGEQLVKNGSVVLYEAYK